jgi:hypothetical protein
LARLVGEPDSAATLPGKAASYAGWLSVVFATMRRTRR